MGVRFIDGEWFCGCGRCGERLGPYKTEEDLRVHKNNWSYVRDYKGRGDTICNECVQVAFDALLDTGDGLMRKEG